MKSFSIISVFGLWFGITTCLMNKQGFSTSHTCVHVVGEIIYISNTRLCCIKDFGSFAFVVYPSELQRPCLGSSVDV